jgi:hypothetical protein
MTAYTILLSKTQYQQTTILAESKEDFLGKLAKLFKNQESPQPFQEVDLDGQKVKLIDLGTKVVLEDSNNDE